MSFKKSIDQKMNQLSKDVSHAKKKIGKFTTTTSKSISIFGRNLTSEVKSVNDRLNQYISGHEFEEDLDLFLCHIITLNDDSLALIKFAEITDKKKRIFAKLSYAKNEVTLLTAKSASIGAGIGAIIGPQGMAPGAAIGSGVAIAGFTVITGQILYDRLSKLEVINLTPILT